MKWLVQRTKREDGVQQRLVLAAEELGHSCTVIDHVPFGEMDVSSLREDEPVYFHGSIASVKDFQSRHLPFRPFAWCDFDKLACRSYYAYWGEFLSQRLYTFLPLAEAVRNRDFLYETYGEDGCIFVRPDSNDKVFTGQIIFREQFDDWWSDAPADLLVVVSKPVDIDAEYRVFLVGGRAVAGSRYKEGRCLSVSPEVPAAVMEFAERVAAVWSPHPVFCLDVATTHAGLTVMECGSSSCAGFYASDVKSFVRAVADFCQ